MFGGTETFPFQTTNRRISFFGSEDMKIKTFVLLSFRLRRKGMSQKQGDVRFVG